MNVPDIIAVKNHLQDLKRRGLITEWELPYENLLTRLNAAIFFVTPAQTATTAPDGLWQELGRFENLRYRANSEKKLSNLDFRVTFNAEEQPGANAEPAGQNAAAMK